MMVFRCQFSFHCLLNSNCKHVNILNEKYLSINFTKGYSELRNYLKILALRNMELDFKYEGILQGVSINYEIMFTLKN